MSKKILVISSANMDFVMAVGAIPLTGQTMVESRSYKYVPGGKGANSALAFARLGADSVFCTRLGRDANGEALRRLYDGAGIDTRYIVEDAEQPTGLAVIMVEDGGANRIIVYPGAQTAVSAVRISRRPSPASRTRFLCSLKLASRPFLTRQS